ncbi:conserved protein of unknown function [Pseudodesulfovibrio profundus]|uniref:Uncharacterized protein n=1 Tax=Pseudodesulfovibrio profundus TaxID=57320 RepID=A0A2C8FBQ4_9BACT|nr:polysaccharide biosynthesis/export family protein [Pseudodesulfovibrio profundus]SOB60068.1 conserved protein of unknown function [Pseudodesulfovibrio profundus]
MNYNRFIVIIFAILVMVTNAVAFDATRQLYLPNSQEVQITPQQVNSRTAGEEAPDESASPAQQSETFRGVTIPPSHSYDPSQHRSLGQSINVNTFRPESMKEAGPLDQLPVFGANMFNGNFAGTYYDERNPAYVIQYGDRISVRVWGAFNYEQELVVDRLGNIFIPSVGPVKVMGISSGSLEGVVRGAINGVYANQYYDAYISLMTVHPMSVFVSGNIVSPGRYAGGTTDSILYYLDLAGGIDPFRGSFRDIDIVRKGRVVEKLDLYEFIMQGSLGVSSLQRGDVIVVKERGISVAAIGQVRTQAWFEFTSQVVRGSELMKYALPMPEVSHVSVRGYRNGSPMNAYLELSEFEELAVRDSDVIEFVSDAPSDTLSIYAEGELEGQSHYLVKKGTRLHDLLNHLEVDANTAALDAIHLKRVTVAQRQAQALADSLFRLEQNALTSSSDSVEEAGIRVKEAELIGRFVERAKNVEMQGIVPVVHDGEIANIYLQANDVVVVPTLKDTVLVTGQVVVPAAVVFNADFELDDYIAHAGGFSQNADKGNVLVAKANGHTLSAEGQELQPGDTIMVLPVYETKSIQLAKDLTQIFFQLAVGTRAILQPIF